MNQSRLDPRNFQIATLLLLLGILIFWRQADWKLSFLSIVLATCVFCQWLGTRWAALPRFEVKSALISCFSLMLLLKSAHLGWVCLVAATAILSNGHAPRQKPTPFQPHQLRLGAWFTPHRPGLALSRAMGTWPFLGLFCLLYGHVCPFFGATFGHHHCVHGLLGRAHFGRALYLGDPMPIPIHSMQNGALLIFAFFMISDPKTTPDTRLGRCLFAGIVALVAYIMQYHFYNPNGLIYALAFLSPLTLLINRWLPGPAYQWPQPITHKTNPFLPNASPAGATP